jgi:GTPase SAR1 family protein
MSNIEEAKRRIRKCIDNQETELNLSSFGLDDLEKEVPELQECIHLTVLNLRFNRLSDCNVLKNLHNLIVLDVRNNKLKSLAGLSQLFDLKELYLYHNQVNDLSQLRNLEKLNVLDINANFISDICPLVNLQSLEILKIANNDVCDLRPLAHLQNLIVLNLSENKKISNINPLINLFNLNDLKVVYSQTTDFRPLLLNKSYQTGNLNVFADVNPVTPELEKAVNQGYESLKAYYDTLDAEGKIQNDQLKVILLGNSTAGKTSLVNYLNEEIRTFNEKQTTTHGIYTPKNFRLREQDQEPKFRVNVWDFGGQDYYHATHRLFITRESTYVLVCNKHLEDKPAQELTTEYMQIGEEVQAVEVPVQHYPYRYWLQTLAFLTQSGKIDDPENKAKDKSQLPKLFLVENKCGIEHAQSKHNQRMRLDEKLSHTLPFEVVGGDFYHIDIQKAYQYQEGKDTSDEANAFHLAYRKFEKQLLQTLRTQIENNRYEVHANFPKIRDILASMAAHMQNREPSPELNEYLAANKIAPIKSYQKLPVWISYDEYRDIVERNSNSQFEDIEGFLHTYLQNLCGRIFHFKDIPSLAHIVFIDPNWLHQTIYKVLNQKVLDNKGEFTLDDADAVIDGNIMDAATFLAAMKAFDLIFEIPTQKPDPRRFVAPQYLPEVCPLHTAGLYSLIEENYELALTLEFSYYLPSSLISRIISKKGHLIKNRQQFLWRNGLLYTDENQVSVFIECKPTERRIEVSVNKKDKNKIQQTLRELMTLLEENFSDEIADAYIVLPTIKAKAKWKHLLKSKEGRQNKVKNYEEQGELVDAEPFWFLFREFERKPLNVFVCYSHEDQAEMLAFTAALTKEFKSFEKQHGININPFTDLELKTGMMWDTVLQERIAQNDLLICLLSPTFFTSSYIQEKEYGKMKQLAEQNPHKLIAPIYVKSCYISEDNEIANLQFYKPSATRFHLSQDSKEFSFSNLLHHSGGSYIQNYVTGFMEEIGGRFLGIWKRK